ncbi:pimeloyl-ACP methyl ester carboxylesterase [Nonomuraea thailandensis]|uniref:Pimeloyl-ACP methyl ester carboxylesterase n=1 Tax=Nonomuraea thailandensis TaxID=1188745 RepID=A0A9X2GBP4_9ACTN|nr:hypothetical protein [Nonomuraea thailandensis]MCP2354710.1 pimeloyl-ACP methyl ester carboxylesterase [Nonomuraea thailandensis]
MKSTDYSFDACLRDLDAVLKARKVERPLLAAWSYGALPGVHRAARHPGRVVGVVGVVGVDGPFRRGRQVPGNPTLLAISNGIQAHTDATRSGLLNHLGEDQAPAMARLTALDETKLRAAGVDIPYQGIARGHDGAVQAVRVVPALLEGGASTSVAAVAAGTVPPGRIARTGPIPVSFVVISTGSRRRSTRSAAYPASRRCCAAIGTRPG